MSDDFFKHFPTRISKKILNYATEEAFYFSRYIFTKRYGKQQYGYCTHCNKEFKTNGLIHGQKTICPECKSKCTVKASGRGRKYMVDVAYFVYYEKSLINPQAIVARGIFGFRDYSQDYRKVKTQLITKAMYLFEPGNVRMIKRSYLYFSYWSMQCIFSKKWEECKSVYSMYSHLNVDVVTDISRDSIKKAVKDTPFSWSGWENYNFDDMTKFFSLYAKYPCIEYLTKLGFCNLVEEKLLGNRTYGSINWRGKNLFSVLRINKQQLNEIKSQKIYLTYELLRIFQLSKKDGSNFTISEAQEIERSYQYYGLYDLEKLMIYSSLRKITQFIAKQLQKYPKHFTHENDALTTLRDYIGDCIELEMDLSDENILFPRNLYNAHQNTIKQIKIKEDKELKKKIAKRLKSLKKYCFEHKGLIIRPAKDFLELIAEGKALNHCVGTYANKYANGETIILLIRKKNHPKKPFYTVEVRQNRVVQVRGFKNCAPTKAVEEFMKAFKTEKLSSKKAKVRVKVPA